MYQIYVVIALIAGLAVLVIISRIPVKTDMSREWILKHRDEIQKKSEGK